MSVFSNTMVLNKGQVAAKRTQRFAKKNPVVAFLIVCAALVLASIILTAISANLQQMNNELELQNQYLEAEIDSISNEITDETTLDKIEKSASHKYGMVYPNSQNYVTIKDDSKTTNNLADAIKDEVYR